MVFIKQFSLDLDKTIYKESSIKVMYIFNIDCLGFRLSVFKSGHVRSRWPILNLLYLVQVLQSKIYVN